MVGRGSDRRPWQRFEKDTRYVFLCRIHRTWVADRQKTSDTGLLISHRSHRRTIPRGRSSSASKLPLSLFARRALHWTRPSLCRSLRAPPFQAPTVAATPHGTQSQPATLTVRRSDTRSSSFRPVHVIQATTSGDSQAVALVRPPLRPALCSKRSTYPDLRITVAPLYRGHAAVIGCPARSCAWMIYIGTTTLWR